MEAENLTLEVLKQIRDEGKKTNERLNETNVRLDQLPDEASSRINETNVRIDQMRDEISRRIVESEMRTATASTALAGNVGELVTFLKTRLPDA